MTMPVVKKTKTERLGYCRECRARFGAQQVQEMLRHTSRTGHTTRWWDLREFEVVPDGDGRDES